MKLLEERYDLSDRPAKGVTMSRGKPFKEGVRAKLPAGVKSWEELGAMTPEEIREKGLWPQGILALAASQPSGRRHGVSATPDRRDQEAGRARPDALRPGLRPADASAARVSARHLPDDSARPRRRVAGAGGHAGELLQVVQRPLESQAVGGAAAAGHSVPAAAVQRHR